MYSVDVLLDALPVPGELVEHVHRVGGDINVVLLSPGLHGHQDNPGIELLLVNLRVDTGQAQEANTGSNMHDQRVRVSGRTGGGGERTWGQN